MTQIKPKVCPVDFEFAIDFYNNPYIGRREGEEDGVLEN